jgi:hypothetical protein
MAVHVRQLQIATDNPKRVRVSVDDRDPRKTPGPVLRAEANFLRFPLFAIHTKGLKSLDGIECSGRMTRGGESARFSFRATRNTATLYPGPLARAIHLAFLSILSEAGTPTLHPLTWTWRDLCRRLDLSQSGRTIAHLKAAITATAGVMIQSDLALFSKADEKLIRTEQQALHLYDRVVFAGMTLPDGIKAEENAVWLSDWYRQNLDAFFTAPLDYALWKYLEGRSPIASRLYEFLLVNLYGAAPVLSIRYDTLVKFLPVRPEKYLSDAKRQLAGAFQLLTDAQVLSACDWRPSRAGLALLQLLRGARLVQGRGTPTLPAFTDEAIEAVEVRELRNLKPPEWHLVTGFYKAWNGREHHVPSTKELAHARTLIEAHGQTRAADIVRHAVKHLRKRFPDAKTFGAITFYLDEAVHDMRRREATTEGKPAVPDATPAVAESEERGLAADLNEWKQRWHALPEPDRQAIRTAVLARQPRGLPKFPALLERLCLQELESRERTVQALSRKAEAT